MENSISNVVAVVSSFNPNKTLIENLREYSHIFTKVIVVDDGSLQSEILNSLPSDKIEIFKLEENSGIAKVLNLGTKISLEKNAEFIVYLDQDSIVSRDYVEASIRSINLLSKKSIKAIIVPGQINGKPAMPSDFLASNIGQVTEGIQSGMVVSKTFIEDVGYFDESLFIDCVDTEICWRAIQKNWKIGALLNQDFIHEMGMERFINLFGFPVYKYSKNKTFTYHKPFRHYYICRNTLFLLAKYFRSMPKTSIRYLKSSVIETAINVVSGPNRSKILIAALLGISHGLIGRRGKIPSWKVTI